MNSSTLAALRLQADKQRADRAAGKAGTPAPSPGIPAPVAIVTPPPRESSDEGYRQFVADIDLLRARWGCDLIQAMFQGVRIAASGLE